MTENEQKNKCFVIFGPTASGKTAFSAQLATLLGADKSIILNADSMQLYRDLPILTACPEEVEYQGIEHHLFEIYDPDTHNSVALWWDQCVAYMKTAFEQNKTVIIIGGTGLYLKSILKGLPQTPQRDEHLALKAKILFDEMGASAFYQMLKQEDPLIEGAIQESDTQRLIRAYEVFHATSKSLLEWQKEPYQQVPFSCEFVYHQIIPDREWLYDRCNRRFDYMIEQGAIEEIDNFIHKYGHDDFDLCRKVIGFDELRDYQAGKLSLEEARDQAAQRTRRYAKRQLTWARTQMSEKILEREVKQWYEWNEETIKTKAVKTIGS